MISDALRSVTLLRPDLDTPVVRRAVAFAREAHGAQLRENGALAFTHPLSVAHILARGGADEITTVAGFLHDTVEDTDVTLADVRRDFGRPVEDVVALLTKPCKGVPPPVMSFTTRPSWSATAFRAVRIKIADRIDNMWTAAVLSRARQVKLALESLRLLCPAADRFDPAAAAILRALSWRMIRA
jgi:GTP pyrophosphokinase